MEPDKQNTLSLRSLHAPSKGNSTLRREFTVYTQTSQPWNGESGIRSPGKSREFGLMVIPQGCQQRQSFPPGPHQAAISGSGRCPGFFENHPPPHLVPLVPMRLTPLQGPSLTIQRQWAGTALGALTRHPSPSPHLWRLSQPAMLLGGLLMLATMTVAQWREQEMGGHHWISQIQHGQCNYTFLLPKPQPCMSEPEDSGDSNSLLRVSQDPGLHIGDGPAQQVLQLEQVLENNTQLLQKLERYIKMNLTSDLVRAQQYMVQNQMAIMLDFGTRLLNHAMAQTRKLTDMEAQVLNLMSRMKNQLLENSRSTSQLERQLLLQGHDLHQLEGRNSDLETRLQALETQHQAELDSLRIQKEQLQHLLSLQNGTPSVLEHTLRAFLSNTSLLHTWQLQLLKSLQGLVGLSAQGSAPVRAAEQVFQDCSEIRRFGATASGVYTIHVANMTEPRKVFCDMEASGGGWTLIQRRENGSVNFQRNWEDYKQGFGDPAWEHWLGNEVVHQLTSGAAYSLRVELQDWEGREAFAQYESFQLGSEGQLYRLSLSGYGGSSWNQNNLFLTEANFSTHDKDNDNCHCNCALLLSGGWWFDACGLSNLNGVYFEVGDDTRNLKGIRWFSIRGPSYSLRATRMMIRRVGV
ncbi:angiopoietin-4-like [Cynocephalus volans]|uniref:angiopoietin-4-like n=1 Tax=Cynocephalus volans TaxID=110931 RepID=UPI002FC99F34